MATWEVQVHHTPTDTVVVQTQVEADEAQRAGLDVMTGLAETLPEDVEVGDYMIYVRAGTDQAPADC